MVTKLTEPKNSRLVMHALRHHHSLNTVLNHIVERYQETTEEFSLPATNSTQCILRKFQPMHLDVNSAYKLAALSDDLSKTEKHDTLLDKALLYFSLAKESVLWLTSKDTLTIIYDQLIATTADTNKARVEFNQLANGAKTPVNSFNSHFFKKKESFQPRPGLQGIVITPEIQFAKYRR